MCAKVRQSVQWRAGRGSTQGTGEGVHFVSCCCLSRLSSRFPLRLREFAVAFFLRQGRAVRCKIGLVAAGSGEVRCQTKLVRRKQAKPLKVAKLANMRYWAENRGSSGAKSGGNRRLQRENACSPLRQTEVAKLAKFGREESENECGRRAGSNAGSEGRGTVVEIRRPRSQVAKSDAKKKIQQ